MSQAISAELINALSSCRNGFSNVVSTIADDPLASDFAAMTDAWNSYYFGVFSQFDSLLRKSIKSGHRSNRFLPISISHHNLHRLMEVLQIELGQSPLKQTRSPERVLDLVAVCDRLRELLNDQSGT